MQGAMLVTYSRRSVALWMIGGSSGGEVDRG